MLWRKISRWFASMLRIEEAKFEMPERALAAFVLDISA